MSYRRWGVGCQVYIYDDVSRAKPEDLDYSC